MNSNVVKLGEYLYIKGRIGWKGLKKEEYLSSGDYMIINGESLTDDGIDWSKAGFITKERYEESPEIMLQKGDILLTKDGTIGKIGYVYELPKPTTVASGVFVIRNIKPELIETRYIYNYLISPIFKKFVVARTEGSVIPHLYQKDFVELDLFLPDLNTQKKIVNLIDTVDNKIEINKQIIQNIYEQVSSIYKFRFEDFGENGGVKPDNWIDSTLGEIVKISSGKRPNEKVSKKNKDYKYLVIGASSPIGYSGTFNYNERVIVTGRVGTHGVLQRFDYPIWASDNTLVIKSDYYEYAYQILSRVNYKALNRGSTQPLITQSDLKSIPILLPDTDALQKFEDDVFDLMNKIKHSELEVKKLLELKKVLLNEVFINNLNVENIEI